MYDSFKQPQVTYSPAQKWKSRYQAETWTSLIARIWCIPRNPASEKSGSLLPGYFKFLSSLAISKCKQYCCRAAHSYRRHHNHKQSYPTHMTQVYTSVNFIFSDVKGAPELGAWMMTARSSEFYKMQEKQTLSTCGIKCKELRLTYM
jgi:hypothetical protein